MRNDGAEPEKPYLEYMRKISTMSIPMLAEYIRGRANIMIVMDCAIMCLHHAGIYFNEMPDIIAELLSAATGFDYTREDMADTGAKIENLERAYHVLRGRRRQDDSLPYRFLHEPLTEGPAKGQVVPLEEMQEDYYRLSRWNSDGVPTRECLEELGLSFVADRLERTGCL